MIGEVQALASLRHRLALRTCARRALAPLRATRDRLRGRTSIVDLREYTSFCARAAAEDTVFASFKRAPAYTAVLEHVTCAQGGAYLEQALLRRPELEPHLDRFRANDQSGGPRTCDYGQYGKFSPTTLRYVKVLADLLNLFGRLDDLTIIEIGGGYGGQCFVLSRICRPASYTLVDLEPALALQRRYLESLGVPRVEFLPMDALGAGTYDLVISNYAFSECVRSVQENYLDRVLRRSARGYLTCNWMPLKQFGFMSAAELLAGVAGSRLLPEVPRTGPQNAIWVWGDAASKEKAAGIVAAR